MYYAGEIHERLRGARDDPSLKGEEERGKIKRVNPRLSFHAILRGFSDFAVDPRVNPRKPKSPSFRSSLGERAESLRALIVLSKELAEHPFSAKQEVARDLEVLGVLIGDFPNPAGPQLQETRFRVSHEEIGRAHV